MSDAGLPPLRWIKAALRETTETLVRELVTPGVAPPAWHDREWRVAQAVATIHGISPLLAERLRWRGPQEWQDFLRDQHEHTERRHARIVTLLEHLDTAARQSELRVVALKGAALHAAGIYRPGERPMSDVDLLVRPDERAAAARMLESLGYSFCYETWKHAVFEPAGQQARARLGEHADNPIKIELHTSIAEPLPFARHDISELVLPSEERSGLQVYRSVTVLMIHLLLHVAGAIAFHSARALQLEDLARVAQRMNEDDWRELVELRESDRLWWAFPPLALLDRYYGSCVPSFVLAAARRSCLQPLRVLYARPDLVTASLSNPRLHAFPGIAWSRTLVEAAQYVKARLRPDADTLAMRKLYGKYQSLGAEAPWVRQAQWQRALRWIVGQRTRVDTLACVRAAFAFAPETVVSSDATSRQYVRVPWQL